MAFGSVGGVVIWSVLAIVAVFALPFPNAASFSILMMIGVFHAINILEWWDQRKERTSRR